MIAERSQVLDIAPAIEPLEARAMFSAGVPRPDHVVIVVEENHSYSEIIGSAAAPYINSLAKTGALFTRSRGVTYPSQPNYLALFSGSTQGVKNNSTPHTFSKANLGSELIAAGLTFAGYSEDLPRTGFAGNSSGAYERKHNPWVNFTNVPKTANLPLSKFPADFSRLPTVSFVVPNQMNDMHDGSVRRGDTWLKKHLGGYVKWAKTHNSLLIVTWDEDDHSEANRIPTLFVGPMVRPGKYAERINHYNVLRTVEDMYGLAYVGKSAKATPITDVWQGAAAVTAQGRPVFASKAIELLTA